jgi:AraC-like DNA-binding protein
VDAVAGLLDGPRASGAFLLRSVLDPPWSLRIQDEAPLSLVAVTRGRAWYVPDDSEPVLLQEGDLAIMRGPDPYALADDPATPIQVVIDPGQQCRSPAGEDLAQAMDLGVRTWGNGTVGSTVMLSGTYESATTTGRRLLEALPTVVILRRDSWDSPIVDLLSQEMLRDEPGQEVVLDRMLDLLVVTTLRAWFSRPEAEAPSWYVAQGDPVVGPALRMLHHHPAHAWTVAELAESCGVSRAAFARRCTELVGEPPMTFLTGWRLALAADLLRRPEPTIGAVAREVGYGSPFSLSTAFKRVHGLSPDKFRRREAAAASA